MSIKVITDSTADIPMQYREKYSIDVIPLYVTIGGKSYKDGVDIDFARLYELVEKEGELPKSSAPALVDFKDVFSKYIKEGFEIIFIGISSEFSATNQVARLAAQELATDKISVIDSRNLSMGIGLSVLEACELAEKGFSRKEIEANINQFVKRVRASFVIETLKYLHMGGRCTSVQMIAGSLLKIQPQIVVENGFMHVGAKYRGKKEKVIDEYLNDFVFGRNIHKNRIFIGHSSAFEEAKIIQAKIKERMDIDGDIYPAGGVISTHCGPGTFGIFFAE